METPGASVAEVARRHDISRSLLWGWRRQARRRLGPAYTGAGFPPMRIAPDTMPLAPAHGGRSEANSDSAIEIRLSDGTTLRVGSDVSAAALRRVLTVLRG
ncbi:transposase [Acidisoma cellulosilytica]|uniref:Transposase n=1 Tax=Acidisoma cellulosilyticum TaxID=2802395 RepID=A0A963Z8K9_9PROT|nr:transposase [Acidisoma cellulosilyticum]